MTPSPKLCPPEIVRAFEAYRDDGVPPGDFARACLENNLLEACKRADYQNLEALASIVAWLYWNMPANLWKSWEAVEAHLDSKSRERASANSNLNSNANEPTPR